MQSYGQVFFIMNGFILLHKKMIDWGWYTDNNTKSVFIHLLLLASWKEETVYGVKLKRGQLITGRKSLSIDLNISERSIRTSLERLKSTSELTIKSTNKHSIITICNYDTYQSKKSDNDQENDQQSDQQTTTLKYINNINNKYNPCLPEEKEGEFEDSSLKESKSESTQSVTPKNQSSTLYNQGGGGGEIIDYLNKVAGKKYKKGIQKTNALINARLKEGFTIDDFKTVIDKKTKDWKGGDFEIYLRPETLFGTKFESYLNEKITKKESFIPQAPRID